MARLLRLEFEGAVYHITGRGNARQKTFLNEADWERFLKILGEQIGEQCWICHAYCLMPNHFHLLLETPNGNLSRGMQRLNGFYTQWFNWRHKRIGHLFQGRYKSIIVDRDSYLLELCRYIVLNPVRARLVTHPGRWQWSSYEATVKTNRATPWLTVDWVIKQFGDQPEPARRAYRRFVMEGIGGPSPWENLKGKNFLGDDTFLANMEWVTKGISKSHFRMLRRHPGALEPQAVIEGVASEFGLDASKVLDRSHRPAFTAAIYLLRRVAMLRLKEVANLCGVSLSRISQIDKHLEETGEGPRLIRRITAPPL